MRACRFIRVVNLVDAPITEFVSPSFETSNEV